MVTLAYILVFALLIPVAKAYWIEKSFLAKIEEREKAALTPVFTIGRKLSAFTIEKSHVVEGSVVLTMNFLRRFKLFWLRLFFGPTKSVKWLIDMARREALLRLKAAAEHATYIINVRFAHTRTNKNEIEVLAYGTSIQLYQDTLGLYFLPEQPVQAEPLTKQSHLLGSFLTSVAFVLALMVGIFAFESICSQNILDNFSDEDERQLWSYLGSSSYISDRNLPSYLQESEKVVQAIYDTIPKSEFIRSYQYQIILIEDEDSKFYIMPLGNIVLSRGFLKGTRSENELYFILAQALYHYQGRKHIEAMGAYIITPYLAMKAFGEDSFLAKWVVRLYSFHNVEFAPEYEDEANKDALKKLQVKYGHVGGIESASRYFINHSGTKSLLDLAKEMGYEIKEGVGLSLVLDAPQIIVSPVNVVPYGGANDDFKKILEDFRKNSSTTINKYNQTMSFMYGVLDPKDLDSKDSIDLRNEYVNFGFSNIEYYRNYINSSIESADHRLGAIINNTVDQDARRVLLSLWRQEAHNVSVIAEFYFERDKEALKTLQGALNFLRPRIGKFSTAGGRVTFALKNDQDSYDGLLKRVNEQLRKTPNSTTN